MRFFKSDRRKTLHTVVIFSLASFLHDVGGEMVFSVWPLYLTGVLGASMTAVGFIDGIGDAIVSFSQAGAGFLSDKIRKRKIFVWIGYSCGFFARIGYLLAPSWQWIVPFRMLDRSGKIRGAPRDAMISDASNHGNRGMHFGILRTMDNLGAVLGIVVAAALIERIGYDNLFLVAAFPSLIAAALVLGWVREPPPRTTLRPAFRWRGLGRNLWLFIILSALFDLGAFSYSFLLLTSQEIGIHAAGISLLYLVYMIAAAAVSFPAGFFADRIGRKPIILLSYAGWIVTVLIFMYLHHSLAGVITAFVMYGLYRGSLDTVQRAFTAELAPTGYVASTLGGFQLVLGTVSLPASIIAGILWDSVSPTAPFVFSLCLAVVAIVLLFFVKEGRPRLLRHPTPIPGDGHA